MQGWSVLGLEPVVGTKATGLVAVGQQPAGAFGDRGVEGGHERFDVQQRRAVEHVDTLDIEDVAAAGQQTHHGQADGIWPSSGARVEKRPRSTVSMNGVTLSRYPSDRWKW